MSARRCPVVLVVAGAAAAAVLARRAVAVLAAGLTLLAGVAFGVATDSLALARGAYEPAPPVTAGLLPVWGLASVTGRSRAA